jgi:hypothetical protein
LSAVERIPLRGLKHLDFEVMFTAENPIIFAVLELTAYEWGVIMLLFSKLLMAASPLSP